MRRKKLPVIKQVVLARESFFKQKKAFDTSLFYYSFFFGLTFKSYFGRTRKERKKLFNDIAIFELACLVIAKIIERFNSNSSELRSQNADRKVPLEVFYNEPIEVENKVIPNLIIFLEEIYRKEKNWDKLMQKIDGRIKFWLQNFNDPNFYYSILSSAIINSIQINQPNENVDDSYNPIELDIDEVMDCSIDIKAFESALLPLFYKNIEDFLNQNQEWNLN